MSDHQNGTGQRKETNWGVMALMTGATSAWLIYDMASASEAPSRALMLLQNILLACALIGLAGALFKLMSQN